jgi:hypothetical protein
MTKQTEMAAARVRVALSLLKPTQAIGIGSIGVALSLGSCGEAEPEPPVASTSHALEEPWAVEVDFAALPKSVARDLMGVNKGPLESTTNAGGGACRTAPASPRDYARLYAKAGVTSVRLHDDELDVSKMLAPGQAIAQSCSGNYTPNNANCVPATDLCRSAGQYLEWTPTCGSQCTFDFARADAAYRAVVANGMRAYLRVGESDNGPNALGPSYAQVAAKATAHFFDPSANLGAPPEFVETFNEPDGGFWAGSDAVSTAAFILLYQDLVDQLRQELPASARIGGAGFKSKGFGPAQPGGNNFASLLLDAAGLARTDFFSMHHYGDETLRIGKAPLEFANKLEDYQAARDAYRSAWGSGRLMHLTEWNMWPVGTDGNEKRESASFVSAALTLLQDPSLSFERAFLYAGRDNANRAGAPGIGMFGSNDQGKFIVRNAAFAMSMHRDLHGRPLAPVKLTQWTSAAVPTREALRAQGLIALAVGGTRREVVLTNLGGVERTVPLFVKGVGAALLARTRTFAPVDGVAATVDGQTVGATVVPVQASVDAAWETALVQGSVPLIRIGAVDAKASVRLPPHGIVRVTLP